METRQRFDRRQSGAGLFEIFFAWILGLILLIAGHGGALRVVSPAPGLLAPTGPVELRVSLPPRTLPGSAVVKVDGQLVAGVTEQGGSLVGELAGLTEGKHTVKVEVRVKERWRQRTIATESAFELATLDRPDVCEVLNQGECVLPFPSSRYLERAATPTGWQVTLPGEALPTYTRFDGRTDPLDTTRIRKQDGFSPTTQILMHFPGGLDVVKSDVSRLLPETRTYDPHHSVVVGSPTVLIDWDTGERIPHWLENDARAPTLERRATFLRPGKSLTPGHRYIVALRNLKDATGAPLVAEPAFAVLRDRRPTTIAGVEARRAGMEETFRRLRQLGVSRKNLVLAFDFVVRSDESLTGEMLAMRDMALDWLDAKLAAGEITFTVDSVEEVAPGCAAGGSFWKLAHGTFQVPLFLTSDPVRQRHLLGVLTRAARPERDVQRALRPRRAVRRLRRRARSAPADARDGARPRAPRNGRGLRRGARARAGLRRLRLRRGRDQLERALRARAAELSDRHLRRLRPVRRVARPPAPGAGGDARAHAHDRARRVQPAPRVPGGGRRGRARPRTSRRATSARASAASWASCSPRSRRTCRSSRSTSAASTSRCCSSARRPSSRSRSSSTW